jgi:DNA polymerase III delta prime subunit
MIAADRSKYLQFVLTDPRHCGNNSFYTATDALLTLEAEVVQKEEIQADREKRTQKQIERLPVVEMLRKYGLGEKREHLLLAGKPGSGKSTTLQRLCVEMAEIALAEDLQPIPIFVQLKGDKPILTLIQAEFRRAKLRVTAEQIDDLLLEDKLVLLLDGVNEIPSEQLRRELQDFRENNLTTPTIFTTRDLTVGGSLGIDNRLEMRPLTEEQMREFVRKYLPEHGDKLLGQLRDRLREIAETPLLLKMLCEVFEPETGRIPQNKAELFELFDRKYQRHKEGVAISADFRRFQSEILQYLAFTMLQGDAQKPTEVWLTLPRDRAEGMLEAWLKQRGETDPASKAKEWLEDLVEHHLLQVAADPKQIEFHHQLFQEYYAARYLRSMLDNKHPDLVDDDRFKHFYLNYLKWTEPLGLLLGLLDDGATVLRMVELGLDVDWFLGARFAEEVKQRFQQETEELVNQLIKQENLPQWLRFKLWQKARSSVSLHRLLPVRENPDICVRLEKSNLPQLLLLLNDDNYYVRSTMIDAIARLGDKSHVVDLFPLLEDADFRIRLSAVSAIVQLQNKTHDPDLLSIVQDTDLLRLNALDSISQIVDKSHVPDLLPFLKDPDSHVRLSAIDAIARLGYKSHVPELLSLLQNSNYSNVHEQIVTVIGKIGDKSHVPDLLPFIQNSNSNVRRTTVETIGKLGDATLLSSLKEKLPKAVYNYEVVELFFIIQANCYFYNYDIFCLSLANQASSQASIPLTFNGDYIVGDKVQGNKIEGHKIDRYFPNVTEVKIFENVDRYYQTLPQDSSS